MPWPLRHVPGGQAIEAWETTCPSCGDAVSVYGEAQAVACPACRTVFSPGATPTRARRKPAAPAPSDPDDPLVGRRLGGWTLLRLLGRGGMGRVYEARDDAGRRRVAVKVLAEELAADATFVRRFRREARVLAALEHPHVVSVLEQGETDGRLWFAMEYVRGENLRVRLARGPLAPALAVEVARQVAAALAYAHGQGVVHRDLKPENVLLDMDDRVHLADFGLSRLARRGEIEATTLLTRTDVILGTWEYMAPEQRRGEKEVDGRADVFALGVILYEMLTGSLPLGRFEPASRLRPDVPASLDDVVHRALAPDREARPASAEALLEALDRAWRDRDEARPAPAPVPAAPAPAPADPARLRSVLRHVELVGALDKVVGLLFVIAGLGFASLGAFQRVVALFPVGGLVLVVLGFWLLSLGGKVTRLERRARDRQVTASVVMLLFPPFGTALGAYALWVFTSDRARTAFAMGRAALEGPSPTVAERVVEVRRRGARRAPWLSLRALWLGAVLWTVYVVLLSLDAHAPYDRERFVAWALSLLGVLVSLGFVVAAWRARRSRRGLGTALVALALFVVDAQLAGRGDDVFFWMQRRESLRLEAEGRPWSRLPVPRDLPVPRLENPR